MSTQELPEEETDPTPQEETEARDLGDGCIRLEKLGPESILTLQALASLLGRKPVSIERATSRGELPVPTRLCGCKVWTVGSILRHLEKRLAVAEQDREKDLARIRALERH